ncbi:hypothetical protein ACVIHI_004985 [Bradyrhizobium sp. USDA 4524]|uniref:hypothetical protein n=1 Tax=Bradyrhizobium TaxID=374 RepID=UPI00209CCE52|nr:MULTISPECIES: hypothetical protein [Bradyrhizobium]MCP1842096.1 hypothetical protein [Bradyrhizobium sp. USDA 4538]MCP1902660.1 hypothetical protein [Bradyrhizobium sp. USDA 4537]MCP1991683.1 hypothetical protein [Bradyrhizobium sp. USDA 4539]MCP3414294.1 hypothetical protein [Bradyrhizobium brasilense]
MLPGLRFLFAAIVLATSLLVFGLGAAALFRAAHEEFASIPARRAPPPEPQFAQQPETPPVLAMVRVDPPAADKVTTDTPAAPSEPAASEQPAAPAEIAAPAAEPEKVAAVTADDPVPPAPPKPEAQATETPAPAQSADTAAQTPTADPSAASEPTPAAAEAAPAATEAKVAAVADPPGPSEPALPPPAPAMAAPEPAPPPSPEAIAAATKIATLGGPEVVVEAPVAPKAAEAKKPERSAVSKPAHRKERRRIVRAPPVRQIVQQQQLDPFGQPTLVPLTRR